MPKIDRPEKSIPKFMQRPETVREKIRQLENRQKILLNRKANVERKARTHRLIERGAILESVFPEIVPMTGEQVKTFLEEK